MPIKTNLLCLALLTIISGSRAMAAPVAAKSAATITQEAKHHFQQGVALYNDGNFSGALAEFEQAYKTKPAATVLYNIGLCYKSLFQYNDAIDTLTRYLHDDKASPERRHEVTQLVAEMRALLADATLTIVPDGAQILLDGRAIGVAPLKTYGIAAGEHTLEIMADGYTPQKKSLMVAAGVPIKLSFTLLAIPKTGRLHLTAVPARARIKIDDKPQAHSPLDLELPAGGHMLEIAADKFEPHKSDLFITAGQTRTLSISLEPQRLSGTSIFKKWYFWVPVSAALVAVGVGVGVGVYYQTKPSGGCATHPEFGCN